MNPICVVIARTMCKTIKTIKIVFENYNQQGKEVMVSSSRWGVGGSPDNQSDCISTGEVTF